MAELVSLNVVVGDEDLREQEATRGSVAAPMRKGKEGTSCMLCTASQHLCMLYSALPT